MHNLSHIVGFDDAPFDRSRGGRVQVFGAVFAGARLDGVISTLVRRDGADSARRLAEAVRQSRFRDHLQLVLLQGIALAGFNVVDIHALSNDLGLPVVVVARRRPRYPAIRAALHHVRGGDRRWKLIEAAGPMEPVGPILIQRVGVSLPQAAEVVRRSTVHGNIPEPLRVAHLVAGGSTGCSRGRA